MSSFDKKYPAFSGKQYDRDYDYKGMAEALDFLVVMDYDSNSYPQDGKKEGPGGACDTCFFANDALPVVKAGVECYKQLGVPASKLVLAFPWCESLPPSPYGSRLVALMHASRCFSDGYDYTCSGTTPNSPFKGHCNVTKSTQISLAPAAQLLATSSVGGGRQWDDVSKTPWFYCEPATHPQCALLAA